MTAPLNPFWPPHLKLIHEDMTRSRAVVGPGAHNVSGYAERAPGNIAEGRDATHPITRVTTP